MFGVSTVFFSLFLLISRCVFSCEEERTIDYPPPQNNVDYEIDSLLTGAEKDLYSGNFNISIAKLEKAELLLPLTQDSEDFRKLRLSLDRAITITCIEGPTERSLRHFESFETLLSTKNCSSENNQPVIRKNWPFSGPDEPMTTSECISTVSNTMRKVNLAAAALPVNKATMFIVQSSIFALENAAKKCCQQRGFWKTCVQPLVNAWKDMEILRIPPDPAWD